MDATVDELIQQFASAVAAAGGIPGFEQKPPERVDYSSEVRIAFESESGCLCLRGCARAMRQLARPDLLKRYAMAQLEIARCHAEAAFGMAASSQ